MYFSLLSGDDDVRAISEHVKRGMADSLHYVWEPEFCIISCHDPGNWIYGNFSSAPHRVYDAYSGSGHHGACKLPDAWIYGRSIWPYGQ